MFQIARIQQLQAMTVVVRANATVVRFGFGLGKTVGLHLYALRCLHDVPWLEELVGSPGTRVDGRVPRDDTALA